MEGGGGAGTAGQGKPQHVQGHPQKQRHRKVLVFGSRWGGKGTGRTHRACAPVCTTPMRALADAQPQAMGTQAVVGYG